MLGTERSVLGITNSLHHDNHSELPLFLSVCAYTTPYKDVLPNTMKMLPSTDYVDNHGNALTATGHALVRPELFLGIIANSVVAMAPPHLPLLIFTRWRQPFSMAFPCTEYRIANISHFRLYMTVIVHNTHPGHTIDVKNPW